MIKMHIVDLKPPPIGRWILLYRTSGGTDDPIPGGWRSGIVNNDRSAHWDIFKLKLTAFSYWAELPPPPNRAAVLRDLEYTPKNKQARPKVNGAAIKRASQR